jgi:hypothetical protein
MTNKVKDLYHVAKRKMYNIFWEKVRLVFVCDVSNNFAPSGPDGRGYEIEISSKTLKYLW